MDERLKTVLGITAAFIAVVLILILFRSKFMALCRLLKLGEEEPSPTPIPSENERLMTPDFVGIAHRIHQSIPDEIKRLYHDQSLIQKKDFFMVEPSERESDVAYEIKTFIPFDLESVDSIWRAKGVSFCFAVDGLGEPYFLGKNKEEPGLSVYLWRSEKEGKIRVAQSLDIFLNWNAIEAKDMIDY